jgi:hypothetical protein
MDMNATNRLFFTVYVNAPEKFTRPIRGAECVKIPNVVNAYGTGLCSRLCCSKHMRSRGTAAAVQRGDPLGKLVSLEIQGVICFLWAQEVSVGDIYLQLVEVYGNAVMSRQQVANSCRTFASGRNNVTEDSRSGRRSSSTTEINTVGVEELVQTDRRVTLLHMAFDLGLYRKELSTGQ